MGSPIDLTDPAVILSEIKRGSDLSVNAAEKGDKVVTDLARRIIELSIADPSLVRGCIENSDDPSLGKHFFEYLNFINIKKATKSFAYHSTTETFLLQRTQLNLELLFKKSCCLLMTMTLRKLGLVFMRCIANVRTKILSTSFVISWSDRNPLLG